MDQQQIAILIQRYLNNTATDAEISQLMQWYNTADINEVQWPDVSDSHMVLHDRMLKRLQQDVRAQKGKVFSIRKLSVAASLFIAVGLAVMIYLLSAKNKVTYISVNNPAGKVLLVHLPDSSKVWLNAGTTLRYNQRFNQHRQLLLEGEAYFDVTKDAAHPFSISTGSITTTVAGTSFTIKAYPSDTTIDVSVLTGAVKVEDEEKTLAMLTPMKRIGYNVTSKTFMVNDADTADAVSWVHGHLQFKGQTLDAITSSLGRWFGYTMRFMQPRAGSCRYYMRFSQHDSIENILPVIKQLTGLTYEINNNSKQITFYGEACH